MAAPPTRGPETDRAAADSTRPGTDAPRPGSTGPGTADRTTAVPAIDPDSTRTHDSRRRDAATTHAEARRDAADTGTAGTARGGDDAAEPVPAAPAGPRPRASLLATIGLIVSMAGIGFVLAGALAGYGIALGAIGAILAVLGLLASRRRHVTGKADGLLGVGIGLAAVVLGVVAMTGQFGWPTADGDWVLRLREWLDSQFEQLF